MIEKEKDALIKELFTSIVKMAEEKNSEITKLKDAKEFDKAAELVLKAIPNKFADTEYVKVAITAVMNQDAAKDTIKNLLGK